MSVSASFWKFSKRKNSTKQPTGTGTQYSVDLKSGTSLISPTLLLNNSGKPDYNYFQFEGMYYFVTDIVSVRNDLWEVYGKVDVLATGKTAILNSTQFVSYSSHNTSSWLADTRIPVLRNCKVSSNTEALSILSSTGCYILSVVGKDSCNTYMITSENDLKQLLTNIQTWQDNGINAADALIETWRGIDYNTSPTPPPTPDVEGLAYAIVGTLENAFDALTATVADVLKKTADSIVTIGKAAVDTGFVGNAYLNAPSCIRSCIWVPFYYNMAPVGSVDRIMLGVYDTGRTGSNLIATPVTGSMSINIPWHYSDWRRGYCEEVYLYLPFVGLIAISSDSITNASSITIEWSATYTDGVIMYKVSAGGEVIGAYGGQCSSNYPLGVAQQSSAGEIVQTAWASAEKVVSSLVKTASAESAGAVVGGLVEGRMGVISGAYDVADMALSKHVSSVGGIGGGAGVGLGTNCICYTVAHDLAVNPSTMAATMGLPTMAPMSLSTLTGFCQCANAHVEADFPAPILNDIDSYINNGFYIE